MKYLYLILIITFISCHKTVINSKFLQTSSTTLSPPIVSIDEAFFNIRTYIRVPKINSQIKIRYTSDNTEPTEYSKIASETIKISDSGVYKFKAFQKGTIPSNTVELEAFTIREVKCKGMISVDAHKNYDSGINILTNRKKGNWNFKSGEWNGYQDSIVNFSFLMEKGEVANGAVISILVDQSSWIFSPEQIILTYNFEDGTKESYKLSNSDCFNESGKKMDYLKINTPPKYPNKIDLTVNNMISIPDWHIGKSLKPWLFVDEILIL